MFYAQSARRRRDAAGDLVAGYAHVLAAEGDLGSGVEIEELAAGVLEHAAHRTRQVVHLPIRDSTAEYVHSAFRRAGIHGGYKPVHHAGKRRLAAA